MHVQIFPIYAMLQKYYQSEEKDGSIRTHYFKKIETEKISKKLLELENMFQIEDMFLDMYINEKERNNFDFYINNILDDFSNNNNLEKWINIDISNVYNYIIYDNKYFNDVITDKKGYLILKLKYTNENKIITSYFKVNCRNAQWDNEKKVWYIPLFYIFEISKLTIFLGGTVSDLVLYYLCKLFHHFSSIKNVHNNSWNNKPNGLDQGKIENGDKIGKKNDLKNYRDNENPEKKEDINKKITGQNENIKENKSLTQNNDKKIEEKEEYNFETFVKKNKTQFIKYIKNVNIFKIEHIIINNVLKSDTLNIKILPYNEEIIKKIRETNLFQWDKEQNIWLVKKKNFKTFYVSVIKFFDYKICSYYDFYKFSKQKLVDSDLGKINMNSSSDQKEIIKKRNYDNCKGNISQEIINKKKKTNDKMCKLKVYYENTDSSYSDELQPNVDASYYEGRELVNTIKLVGAANNYYKEIIYNKLNKIKKLKPPNYAYDPKGCMTKSGAGTKGIEIYDMPSDINEWNKISFCIVPNDYKKNLDLYDPKILCSLVSDVYMLKENAVDIILKKYNKWPEYSDVFWNNICAENEFIVNNKSFNTRQKLAHDRLFNKQYFYIFNINSIKQSNYYDPLFLCKTLIKLGEGILVSDPIDADYVIIHNSEDSNAINFYTSLQETYKNQKKKKKNFLYLLLQVLYMIVF